MRNISFFVIAAALIIVGAGGWIASTSTHADAVKVEDTFAHRSTPTGGSTLPLTF
jgi:ABC-type glycerol-3-phosphate transport system substrate-binding protein